MADIGDGEKVTYHKESLGNTNKKRKKEHPTSEDVQPHRKGGNYSPKRKRRLQQNDGNLYSQRGDELKSENKNNVDHNKMKESVVYYENLLKDMKQNLNQDSKDSFIESSLEESEGIEVDLSCHAISSHCLELLLTECESFPIMMRFMLAFSKNKVPVFTSPNASHVTEILIHYAVRQIQNWFMLEDSEGNADKEIVSFCVGWLLELGDFALQNLKDCLGNLYSCHVLCTLVRAFAGDLSKATEFSSKNLKVHKQEFRSQYIDETVESQQKAVVLEQIPKPFSKTLKYLYKSLIKLDNLHDYVSDSSSATVVEVLFYALKKRLPKKCGKMISKMAEVLFSLKDQDGVPLHLLDKNSSFVINEMFKAVEQDLQVQLWNAYIVEHLGKLVSHSVGNFVIQRLLDDIQDKNVFEAVCQDIWNVFEEILNAKNFGIFVSIANACNKLNAQQAPFMVNIMKCLHCYEPNERQDLLIPLLVGFQLYENYTSSKNSSESNLIICLQGSLVAQAVLKFHKTIKVVQSMLSMAPTDIEFLAGHRQGCHVLNAFFCSITVGEKNKEKMLNHIKPVLTSIASDREKSLTLSRIWVNLSLKLKENIARELEQNKKTVASSRNGFVILQKFGIHNFRQLQEWKKTQSSICNKRTNR